MTIRMSRAWGAAGLAALLAACGSGSSSDSTTVTVNGDVALAYAKRSTAMTINPTNGAPSAPGGDLMVREKSSPSAPEHNLTALFTRSATGVPNGDVSDPEVSYDGKKIVFTMKCPAANPATIGGVPACTGRWNIWEYDMTSGGLTGGTFRRLTASTDSDDVDPVYLPAGRGFVFSSNRQTVSKVTTANGVQFNLDEYERERVLNLHTMDAAGGAITQISFNASHDRNPVIRPNGDIMFSRWEHVGPRNRFAIFRAKPDGTDMFVLYGAHSPGNSFLHPRDMDPDSKSYKGFVASDLMALSRTQEGGSLMFIDAANYSEQNTPARKGISATGGQTEVTAQPLSQDRGLSEFGRITAPYPLLDGTDRVLLAYRPCEVTRDGAVIPCAQLTAAERARLEDGTRTREQSAADSVKDNAPAAYAIYMYDPAKQTFLNVAAAPTGFMYTDPVAIQKRTEPNSIAPTVVDTTLESQKLGLIEVRSIYDSDGLNRMTESVLTAADLPAGCTAGIAQTTPTDATDTRTSVADVVRIKDPADPAYHCSPVRWVRASRAAPAQAGMTGVRRAIGETDFEPVQILGYAPIEPDGSFKLQVPADTPIALSILDSKGRSLQTHLNWIQVRPGERRTCDGCHSPRRGASLNSGDVVNAVPTAIKGAMTAGRQLGETMASMRTRLDPAKLQLATDLAFDDVWADTAKPGVTSRASLAVKYTGNANPADDLATAVPANGFINYPDHVQPIWTRTRAGGSCVSCHADPVKLDLRGTTAGSGRLASYEELVLGDPQFDATTGLPVVRLDDGVPEIVRGPALVETGAGNADGLSRSSRLTEILFGERLKASAAALTAHPTPAGTAPDHAAMLNKAEKRLVTEWMDLGGQFYNDLNATGSGVRTVNPLSETVFTNTVYPILQASCGSCHLATGNAGAAQANATFVKSRYVLLGSEEGDYNVTLGMVTDVCNAASNALLARPSTLPHPPAAAGQTAAVLPAGSANYNAIATWITSGCTSNP